jgi:nicotinamide-nucleotide amidase
MTAEIISVGTELLLGDIVDTNAAYLGQYLAKLGIQHTHRQTVGDNKQRLVAALELALKRVDIVFTIGGLGPTQDDLTREGVAEALQDNLILDKDLEAHLIELFAQRKYHWTGSQIRQAFRPSCADPLPNPNGTAPGLFCKKNGKYVFCLPGPPSECLPMLEGPVRAILSTFNIEKNITSLTLRIVGIGEGLVEDKLKDLMLSANPTVAPYAKSGEVHVRISALAKSPKEAKALIDPIESEIRERLGQNVFGSDDTDLEAVVVKLLSEKHMTIATAESCTAGGLASRITNVEGSSSVFPGGVITYSDEIKSKMLNVSALTLKLHGAVSSEVAIEMALGIRHLYNSDLGVSITGIAGPSGSSKDKPVGLVHMAIADHDEVIVKNYHFMGTREQIRVRAAQFALIHLYEKLKG